MPQEQATESLINQASAKQTAGSQPEEGSAPLGESVGPTQEQMDVVRGKAEPQKGDDASKDDSQWDKMRQQYDQERANLRKEFESQIQQSQQVNKDLQELLRDVLSHRQTSGNESQPETPTKTRISQLVEKVSSMGEDPEYSEVTQTLREMVEAIAERDASPPKAEVPEELSQTLKTLSEQVSELTAERTQQQQQAKLNSLLDGLDEEFGARYRTDAVAAVQEELDERGLTGKNRPSDITLEKMLRLAYLERATQGGSPAGRTPPPIQDPGGDGKSDPPIRPGSLADYMAQKRARLRNK